MTEFKTLSEIAARITPISREGPNVLADAGPLHLELLHSDIIASMLRHELAIAPDSQSLLLAEHSIPPIDSGRSVRVDRERNHIDILVTNTSQSGERVALIIENKVGAGDQEKQIQRYVRSLINEGYDIASIYVWYLSPDGHAPSAQSVGEYADKVTAISYRGDIWPWMQELAKRYRCTQFGANAAVYGEALRIMTQEDERLAAAFDQADKHGVEPEQAEVLVTAAFRRCHRAFLRRLRSHMISEAKSERGISLQEHSAWDSIDAARTEPEYGFAFRIADRLAYGVSFAWTEGGDYYLYTGLLDPEYDGSRSDYVLPEEIAESVSNNLPTSTIKQPAGIGVNCWYIWVKTQDGMVADRFSRNAHTKTASCAEWEDWAREYAERFLEDYRELAKIAGVQV